MVISEVEGVTLWLSKSGGPKRKIRECNEEDEVVNTNLWKLVDRAQLKNFSARKAKTDE